MYMDMIYNWFIIFFSQDVFFWLWCCGNSASENKWGNVASLLSRRINVKLLIFPLNFSMYHQWNHLDMEFFCSLLECFYLQIQFI